MGKEQSFCHELKYSCPYQSAGCRNRCNHFPFQSVLPQTEGCKENLVILKISYGLIFVGFGLTLALLCHKISPFRFTEINCQVLFNYQGVLLISVYVCQIALYNLCIVFIIVQIKQVFFFIN